MEKPRDTNADSTSTDIAKIDAKIDEKQTEKELSANGAVQMTASNGKIEVNGDTGKTTPGSEEKEETFRSMLKGELILFVLLV